MAHIPSGFISHTQKVCRLYKRVVRNQQYLDFDRANHRLQQTIIRDIFEKNRHIKDARVAKKIMIEAEEELFQKRSPFPFTFPDSPGGIAYDNYSYVPDHHMDMWTIEEKSRYPKYFKKREEMKKEYRELYYKMYPEHKEPEEKK